MGFCIYFSEISRIDADFVQEKVHGKISNDEAVERDRGVTGSGKERRRKNLVVLNFFDDRREYYDV